MPGSPPLLPVLVALALSLIGDVALLTRRDGRFLVGLAAFLLAHVAYVWAILETPGAGASRGGCCSPCPPWCCCTRRSGATSCATPGRSAVPVLLYQLALFALVLAAAWKGDRRAARLRALPRLRHGAWPRPLRPRAAVGAAHRHRDLPPRPDLHRRRPLPLSLAPVEWPRRSTRAFAVHTSWTEARRFVHTNDGGYDQEPSAERGERVASRDGAKARRSDHRPRRHTREAWRGPVTGGRSGTSCPGVPSRT